MENPKCPKCPYNKDTGIVQSVVNPRKWYCCNCGSYFDTIANVAPSSLKSLVVLEKDNDLRWAAEEVIGASDTALAQFYAGINSDDRALLLRNHILVNGDFRDEEKRCV